MHFPNLTGILFLFVIGIILFGPSKLPQLGRAVGSTLKEFKLASQGLLSETKESPEKSASQQLSEQEYRMQIEQEIRAEMERGATDKNHSK
ncbi:hypothetical protein BRE01_00160 [Brevibacillus reuszeri]|uniref:Sec-independent protein translocase protein TatA n=1 Tax=Brevibacillus reuszeri TaxID=54915 RepID=A0A0K9YRV5_9BACL|nr:twin-arginine translocase TatA/TatE family subunit [Brevibacillus reuszeri]KNB71401.1 hypothetical protein ADS79_21620 [Brevibacillus reuszeri]MED1857855.1 twin-arginine translocase TatA/TatE family subunit [Brevibacillus reuszeri]GED66314.1 hypothetical protein BRE01_00160 [Brevibacillus reuszeri]